MTVQIVLWPVLWLERFVPKPNRTDKEPNSLGQKFNGTVKERNGYGHKTKTAET